ncbi:MAG TPA: nickel pincer cofactor biosynthesis protein LarC [Bacteroidota bacterium]|nr:nickel pincer cofactor biosynthesis protein LarC [Bacteroidota bacterium]
MRIAYLDTVGGIAGDMTMAAFVSAGVPFDELRQGLGALGIGGFELAARHVTRNAVDALHIDVVATAEHHVHRHMADIERILEASALGARVKERARAVFTLIAQAEAKVHGTTPDRVHFHEVGALDSIVDITGSALCMEIAGIDAVYSSPVKLGSGGTVQTRHGTMPVPAPATIEILRGYPTVLTNVPHELTTPTGAAIVRALSSGVLNEERLLAETIGYGAGTNEFPELPNLLRVIIGTLETPREGEDVVIIETNIDDMNPQAYPYVIERLLQAGAHDAYLVPVVMKKGRPGILLSAMAERSRLDAIVGVLYRETSTIGLRIQQSGRLKLPRRHLEVQTSFGPVRAKAVVRDGKEVIAPEYEECKRIAAARDLPLLEVMRRLEQEVREGGGSAPSAARD